MRENPLVGAALAAVLMIAVVALARCGDSSASASSASTPTKVDQPKQADEATKTGDQAVTSIYTLPVTTIGGEKTTLAPYKGKAMLIVNTASQCGYTSQYKGLQSLYEAKKDEGLVVLGFPCNQFGGQEPGSESEIATFVKEKYGVTFPMFAKVAVKGSEKDPLFAALTDGRSEIGWNFSKFLVGKDGKVLASFDSGTAPNDPKLMAAIDGALK